MDVGFCLNQKSNVLAIYLVMICVFQEVLVRLDLSNCWIQISAVAVFEPLMPVGVVHTAMIAYLCATHFLAAASAAWTV